MKLAVLCSDDAHHGYLLRRLADRFPICAVIVEPARQQRRSLLATQHYRDWWWALYHFYRREILGLNRYRKQFFGRTKPAPIEGAAWLCVSSINDRAVSRLLADTKPDLTIIIGTTKLNKETLGAARIVINIHGGFLPYYRGNHCFFFALYENAFDHIGSTIHFVDAGIDTGDIIDIVVPSLFPDDNAEKLYCRAEQLAIHRLIELLEAHERGIPLPRCRQGFKRRAFRNRDRHPGLDIALWLRLRLGMTRIPLCQNRDMQRCDNHDRRQELRRRPHEHDHAPGSISNLAVLEE